MKKIYGRKLVADMRISGNKKAKRIWLLLHKKHQPYSMGV
jgi:hypothetical protein